MKNCRDCHSLTCAEERTTYCPKHKSMKPRTSFVKSPVRPKQSGSKTSKKPKKTQSNGFCLTIQNYDKEDIEILESYYHNDYNCKYLIYGPEKARTGTPHLQVYIYYTKKLNVGKVIKMFSPWHVKAQKAKKNVNAYVYCMKDGEHVELGERPRQGHRTDLEAIKCDLKKGKSIRDISNEYFAQWCQYSRQFDRFKEMHKPLETKIIIYSDDPKYIIKQFDIMKKYQDKYVYPATPATVLTHVSEILILKSQAKYQYIFLPTSYFTLNEHNAKYYRSLIDDEIWSLSLPQPPEELENII